MMRNLSPATKARLETFTLSVFTSSVVLGSLVAGGLYTAGVVESVGAALAVIPLFVGAATVLAFLLLGLLVFSMKHIVDQVRAEVEPDD